MPRTGRPKVEISKIDFEKLCAMMATENDIADWFECSIDTICRWCKRTYKTTFADIYKKKSAKGRVSLRRKQFELAQQGNVTLLIWLGKQQLGQRDYYQAPTVQASVDGKASIVVRWTDGDNPGDAPADAATDKARPVE